MMQSSHRLTIARLLPIVIGALLAAPASAPLPLGLEAQPHAVAAETEALTAPPDGFVRSITPRPLIEPDRSRGEVALRGIFWGALVGGFLGYHADAQPDALLAPFKAVSAAAIGAPIGMVVFLVATAR